MLKTTPLSYQQIADKVNEEGGYEITDQIVYFIKRKYLNDLDREALKKRLRKEQKIKKLKEELEELNNNEK